MKRGQTAWQVAVMIAIGSVAGAPAIANPAPGAAVRRSISMYQVPDVTLVREDGQRANMRSVLNQGGPVLVGFVFTTCTAICPLTSATFQQVQNKLGPKEPLQIATISIDPEQDSPARLREYARQFGAGPNWHFYTGSQSDSVAMQRGFDAYRGDKMEHTAVAFMRAAPGKPWVRIDGFASAARLIDEYRAMKEPGALALR